MSTDEPRPEGRPFTSFELPEPVMAGMQAAGFTHCTPIQEKVLPLSLAGSDVAGQAQTGTGKTAAFLITIFTRLLQRERAGRDAGPRALVIAPTRELVVQITDDARLLGQATPFTIHAVYGGVDYKKQRDQVEAGVDLLVGTPGRLIDYHRQHVLDLRSVEMLVIDEADRMFDMGFIKDLRYLLRRLPPYDRRQSMLFSATLSYDVMELAYVFMNDAEKVSVTPEQVTAENIEHLVYHVGTHEKLPLLVGLLRRDAGRARARLHEHEAHRRAPRAQPARQRLLRGRHHRRRRPAPAAAHPRRLQGRHAPHPGRDRRRVARPPHRGRDPRHQLRPAFRSEDYVHRAGRTARAGASGHAITLACEDYVDGLEAIERYIGFKLPHDFPDDRMLAHDLRHAPRPPRDDRDRRGRGRQAPRPRRAEHGSASHPPEPRPRGAAPSGAAGAPKKRRRRRRRGAGAPGRAAPTS